MNKNTSQVHIVAHYPLSQKSAKFGKNIQGVEHEKKNRIVP